MPTQRTDDRFSRRPSISGVWESVRRASMAPIVSECGGCRLLLEASRLTSGIIWWWSRPRMEPVDPLRERRIVADGVRPEWSPHPGSSGRRLRCTRYCRRCRTRRAVDGRSGSGSGTSLPRLTRRRRPGSCCVGLRRSSCDTTCRRIRRALDASHARDATRTRAPNAGEAAPRRVQGPHRSTARHTPRLGPAGPAPTRPCPQIARLVVDRSGAPLKPWTKACGRAVPPNLGSPHQG